MMKIPRCKGARDLLPEDMLRFRQIEEAFRTLCTLWGYQEIRTPTLEYLHLFTSAGTLTPEMLSRVYTFLDWDGWSGERVVLRPDGTIPTARFYVENMADSPLARLFYIENMFSFEDTGQKSRERWQCGAEMIGGMAPEGDAELIMLALEILNKVVPSPVSVKLSHVGVFKSLLKEMGLTDEERARQLKEILSGDIRTINSIEGQPPGLRRFVNLIIELQGESEGFLENLKSVLPAKFKAARACLEDLERIVNLLEGIGQHYQIDFASAKGFEYYTGMVYQFYSEGNLLGNGGRYDELIPLIGGKNIPASGFALFADRIDPVLNDDAWALSNILLSSEIDRPERMKSLFEVAGLLRAEGYVVRIDLGDGSPAQFRWKVSLNRKGKQIQFNLTDMATGTKEPGITRKRLLQLLKSGSK